MIKNGALIILLMFLQNLILKCLKDKWIFPVSFLWCKMRNFYGILPKYIERLSSSNSVSIEELKAISNLLRTSFALTYKADFFKREAALEDCRKVYNIALPSRLHSIYLCDEDGLEYWKDILEECSQMDLMHIKF